MGAKERSSTHGPSVLGTPLHYGKGARSRPEVRDSVRASRGRDAGGYGARTRGSARPEDEVSIEAGGWWKCSGSNAARQKETVAVSGCLTTAGGDYVYASEDRSGDFAIACGRIRERLVGIPSQTGWRC